MSRHVFGIRHHGPGSARSLRRTLEALRPDAILVEGPPDAEPLLPLVAYPGMRPPVALLIYQPEQPERAAYYPFAAFSPEWQAIEYGLRAGVPVRFMDLPQANQLVFGPDLNRPESSRPPLPFAPPHSATASCSKGRLIRCTVPGLTPNCLAMTRTPGLPGVARASRIRFSSAGAIGGRPRRLPSPLARARPARTRSGSLARTRPTRPSSETSPSPRGSWCRAPVGAEIGQS